MGLMSLRFRSRICCMEEVKKEENQGRRERV